MCLQGAETGFPRGVSFHIIAKRHRITETHREEPAGSSGNVQTLRSPKKKEEDLLPLKAALDHLNACLPARDVVKSGH